jgi:hypothetical protein
MKGKPPKVDLLRLYSETDITRWNEFLTNCKRRLDLATLESMLYGVQLGMDDLAKKKLNTEKMCVWFIRLQKSIENTMRDIIRIKMPNPCDNPLVAGNYSQFKDEKKNRDNAVESYLRKVRF